MRAETGSMQFGNEDWPGVFIRGDDAAYYSMLLEQVLDAAEKSGALPTDTGSSLYVAILKNFGKSLSGCIVDSPEGSREPAQMMRDYKECLAPTDDFKKPEDDAEDGGL